MVSLPRGIALVRVDTKNGRALLISDRLSPDQEQAARVMACVLSAQGLPIVVLRVVDVLAALHDAA